MSFGFRRIIPNVLTALRLAVVPFALYCIVQDELDFAFYLFAFAACTDYVDGYLARRWQVESRFGRIFDPIADKVLLMGSYIALTYTGHVPTWLMYLIVGRDILILLGAVMVYVFNLPVRLTPFFMSKVNTFFQIVLVCFLLKEPALQGLLTYDHYMLSGLLLLYLTVFTTILSGIEYIFYFVRKNLRTLVRRGT